MRVQYITSACVVIEHGGTRVLCDPWLTDGIYYGSWFHYPPNRFKPEDFSDVDYIYLSHIHPDHADAATLERLPKSTPVLIHDFAEKFLYRLVSQLGFRNIRQIPHRGEVSLGTDFTIKSLAADNCDPVVCGRFFSCWWFPTPYTQTMYYDSLAIFRGGDKTVVNMNDCPYPLTKAVCDELKGQYGQIDFLLTNYSGAGEYPQCFDGMGEAVMLQQASSKRKNFLDNAVGFVRHLRPRHFMPFAGQYTLGGQLARLNAYRGVPELEEIPSEFAQRIQEAGLSSQMVLLNPGEYFDVDNSQASAPFAPPNAAERQRYVDEVLAPKRYPYEVEWRIDPSQWMDLTTRLKQAQARMLQFQEDCRYKSDWKLYLDTDQKHLYCIPFDGGAVEKAQRGSEKEPFLRIRLDYSLLEMILDKRAHWNNAVIGSHLRFFRRPETFERALYHCLCYLHC